MKSAIHFYLVIFLVIILQINLAYSQVLPELHEVEIKATVEFDENPEFYLYDYRIKNNESSNAAIIRLALDISRKPESVTFDTSGLWFYRNFDRFSFELKYPNLKDDILPVSFAGLPEYWNGAISDTFEAWFSTQRDRNDIRPGEEKGGFKLMSKGLPTIRLYRVLPFFNVDELYPSELEVNNADSLFAIIAEDRKKIELNGYTIGPKAPSIFFTALGFLDTLIEYKEQSCDLGWIENRGICRSLQANLDNVKRQLEQGRTQTATNNLLAFLNEVEAIREQHLSPEAYALLRFNGEYLLRKLQENE